VIVVVAVAVAVNWVTPRKPAPCRSGRGTSRRGRARTRPRIVAGVHTISATYEPTDGSAFVGSSSPAITFTVNKK
jgi:hypothetical protein